MKRVKFPISMNYVAHWGIAEGLRELFQNAMDAGEGWTGTYNGERKILEIKSQDVVSRLGLLLGEGTKASDKTKLGNFGEGMKLAFLALLREGVSLSILNGKEKWEPKFMKDRALGVNVLVVEISPLDEKYPGFFVTLNGLEPEDWEAYQKLNLSFQAYDSYETSEGEILLDMKYQRKVFVGGLYVGELGSSFLYGYNFNPGILTLGRDRNLVDTSSVSSLSSSMFYEVEKEDSDNWDRIYEGLCNEDELSDFFYFDGKEHTEEFYKFLWARYDAVYTGIPVGRIYSQKEMAKKYKDISTAIVSYRLYATLRWSPEYERRLENYEKIVKPSPLEVVEAFIESLGLEGFEEAGEDLKDLKRKADEWRWISDD